MATPTTAVGNDPKAHELLRGAHDAGYRFPEGFAGFAATVTYDRDGALVTGRLEVRSPREIALEIAADEEAVRWLRQELGSMAGHRWPSPYEAGDGRWTLSLDPDDGHPLGRLVRVHDDPFDSSYRIDDGRIAQVNRRMGEVRFAITIQEHAAAADGRALPAAFTVAYWNVGRGRLTRADAYRDRYATVEGVSLPAERRVVTAEDGGVTLRRLLLSEHALLAGTGGDASVAANGNERAGTRAG